MADPLSVTASILALVTASVVSIKSLKTAIERYKGRDETLRRLLAQLDDLVTILRTLEQAAQMEASMLALLQGPVERCKKLCSEFEAAMESFAGKSRTGILDWAKLEFMKGNINEFMDTLSSYKTTISVGLGTITLQTSMATQDILERYNELVQDTAYNLNIQLQRINEKIECLPSVNSGTSVSDLKDEKTVIEHCIRICEEAMSYLASSADRERRVYSDILAEQSTTHTSPGQPRHFRVHQETRELLNTNRDSIAKHLGTLQERLRTLTSDAQPSEERQRAQLEDDIKAMENSLEVCKIASGEVTRQTIHSFGEIVAEGESYQAVVTTWADLFNVAKAISKGKSRQIVGSMTGPELIQLSKDQHSSPEGAVGRSQVDVTLRDQNKEPRESGQGNGPTKPAKANPNEVRKRMA